LAQVCCKEAAGPYRHLLILPRHSLSQQCCLSACTLPDAACNLQAAWTLELQGNA
jgi:hypothetical protein